MNLRTPQSVALLGLTGLLLAACGPQNGTAKPDPDTLTAPAAPVVGQATELQDVPAAFDRATTTLEGLLDPASPDFDPDLKVVLGALGRSEAPNLTASPLNLGRDLTRALARRGAGGIRPLDLSVNPGSEQALPTGTLTIDAAGKASYSEKPSTGYVEVDQRKGTTLTVDWHVGGAPTVWVDYPQGSGSAAFKQEVPTHASATFTKGNRKLAAAQLSLTPGACLDRVGPEALSLSGWAGRENNAPAALDLRYAWTDSGITLKASAVYRTRTRGAEAAVNLDLRGSTAYRCTPALAFTPTRADLTASVKVPGDQVQATLNLRKLSNLVISDAELKAKSPFARVTGDLSASVQHNGQPLLTAFGPLADGADLNLLPGDQVVVRYVEHGKLVETNLPDALEKLLP